MAEREQAAAVRFQHFCNPLFSPLPFIALSLPFSNALSTVVVPPQVRIQAAVRGRRARAAGWHGRAEDEDEEEEEEPLWRDRGSSRRQGGGGRRRRGDSEKAEYRAEGVSIQRLTLEQLESLSEGVERAVLRQIKPEFGRLGAGSPQHGLSSKTMTLVTSECGATRFMGIRRP